MKLRHHARLAVMKVEEEEARSDCSREFPFDSLRNQLERQKWIHHHKSICTLFQKARGFILIYAEQPCTLALSRGLETLRDLTSLELIETIIQEIRVGVCRDCIWHISESGPCRIRRDGGSPYCFPWTF
ncbi:S-protein [Hirschfeldia incana]|nr:S-protein [Hirschfeldia incana]